jgi:hypothetical protein
MDESMPSNLEARVCAVASRAVTWTRDCMLRSMKALWGRWKREGVREGPARGRAGEGGVLFGLAHDEAEVLLLNHVAVGDRRAVDHR